MFFRRSPLLFWTLSCLVIVSGCRSSRPITTQKLMQNRDRLAAITLTDQHGHEFSLSSLKGRFALFDFIYTSCPGECLLTTARMARVAKSLGSLVGPRLTLVSVTVDPEHDGPAQLLHFARSEGVDTPNWFFLTGAPEKIEQVLKDFNLPRERQPDGVIDHVTYCFLIGPDGREAAMYDPTRASSEAIAKAIKAAMVRSEIEIAADR